MLGLLVGIAIVAGVLLIVRRNSPQSLFGHASGDVPTPDSPTAQTVPPPQPSEPAAAATAPPPPVAEPTPTAPVVETTPQVPNPEPVKPTPVAVPSPAPAPAEASVQLTTTPSGAEAVVDGSASLHCTSPCSLKLPLGRHTVAFRHEGYRDVQRIFNLPDDPGLIVNMVPQTGILSLVSTPAGLAIVVDGQQQGRKTPASISLPVGSHRVQILKGGEKQEFTVDVRDGVLTERNINWGN